MKIHANPNATPQESAIVPSLSDAYYHDCYAISVTHSSCFALDYFLNALGKTPRWISWLMLLRNRIVRVVGLKDLGGLDCIDPAKAAVTYRPGERVGIFTLISNSPHEAILGDADRHLDVVLSVFRGPEGLNGTRLISVTTVVHVHNLLGRVYMLFVKPLHKIIAPAVLSRAIGHGIPYRP